MRTTDEQIAGQLGDQKKRAYYESTAARSYDPGPQQSCPVSEPHISEVEAFSRVGIEVASARTQFAPFNSAHEGYAVLLEEVRELEQEVFKKYRDTRALRKEAVQVAAMAIRFLLDVDNRGL